MALSRAMIDMDTMPSRDDYPIPQWIKTWLWARATSMTVLTILGSGQIQMAWIILVGELR